MLRLPPVIPGRRILSAAGLAAAKHLHGATNIDHHLCGVFILAGLIGPFACAQLALDVNLGAFTQIFTRNFCQLAENNHPVPFSHFFLFSGLLIAPALRRGQRKGGNCTAVGNITHFRILAEISDKDNLVNAA